MADFDPASRGAVDPSRISGLDAGVRPIDEGALEAAKIGEPWGGLKDSFSSPFDPSTITSENIIPQLGHIIQTLRRQDGTSLVGGVELSQLQTRLDEWRATPAGKAVSSADFEAMKGQLDLAIMVHNKASASAIMTKAVGILLDENPEKLDENRLAKLVGRKGLTQADRKDIEVGIHAWQAEHQPAAEGGVGRFMKGVLGALTRNPSGKKATGFSEVLDRLPQSSLGGGMGAMAVEGDDPTRLPDDPSRRDEGNRGGWVDPRTEAAAAEAGRAGEAAARAIAQEDEGPMAAIDGGRGLPKFEPGILPPNMKSIGEFGSYLAGDAGEKALEKIADGIQVELSRELEASEQTVLNRMELMINWRMGSIAEGMTEGQRQTQLENIIEGKPLSAEAMGVEFPRSNLKEFGAMLKASITNQKTAARLGRRAVEAVEHEGRATPDSLLQAVGDADARRASSPVSDGSSTERSISPDSGDAKSIAGSDTAREKMPVDPALGGFSEDLAEEIQGWTPELINSLRSVRPEEIPNAVRGQLGELADVIMSIPTEEMKGFRADTLRSLFGILDIAGELPGLTLAGEPLDGEALLGAYPPIKEYLTLLEGRQQLIANLHNAYSDGLPKLSFSVSHLPVVEAGIGKEAVESLDFESSSWDKTLGLLPSSMLQDPDSLVEFSKTLAAFQKKLAQTGGRFSNAQRFFDFITANSGGSDLIHEFGKAYIAEQNLGQKSFDGREFSRRLENVQLALSVKNIELRVALIRADSAGGDDGIIPQEALSSGTPLGKSADTPALTSAQNFRAKELQKVLSRSVLKFSDEFRPTNREIPQINDVLQRLQAMAQEGYMAPALAIMTDSQRRQLSDLLNWGINKATAEQRSSFPPVGAMESMAGQLSDMDQKSQTRGRVEKARQAALEKAAADDKAAEEIAAAPPAVDERVSEADAKAQGIRDLGQQLSEIALRDPILATDPRAPKLANQIWDNARTISRPDASLTEILTQANSILDAYRGDTEQEAIKNELQKILTAGGRG